jgi:hypothetical protein
LLARLFALCCVVGWSISSSVIATELSASSHNIHSSFSIAKPPGEANQAASNGKLILEKLVSNDNQLAKDLGFSSVDEATEANMSVGTPMAVVPINIDALRDYTPTRSFATLVRPTTQFIYPIKVKGKVRSSITVAKVRKTHEWKAVGFGAIGAPLAAEELGILESAFVIRVGALELIFIGMAGSDDLYQLTSNPARRIGKPKNAQQIFVGLAEEVRRIKTFLRKDPAQKDPIAR